MAIEPEFLAALRRQCRAEMVLVLVQLEQVCPGWWIELQQLAEQLGTERATLNRSLRHLEKLDLLRRYSAGNSGGTWIWWVKRHAADQPRPEDEPAWVLQRQSNRHTERVPVSQRREWARARGIPYASLSSLLQGHQTTLHGRWKLVGSPMDAFMNDCYDAAGLADGRR